MIIRVDATLALPVYEQIRDQVTRMAVAGSLAVGTRLPPIRQLANDLELAKGTVAKAYAMLEQDGVVESQGRRGTIVTAFDRADVDVTKLSDHADRYATAARQMGASLDEALDQLRAKWDLGVTEF